MHAVITTVAVRDGTIDELARLFAETNPALVAAHDDWVGAWFTADRATHTVTVIAHWTDPASYEALRSSPDFGATMGRFADHFAGPPSISIHEILVAM